MENKNTSEEIDLEQLFRLFYKIGGKMKDALGSLIMQIFGILITILIFFKKNAIKLIIGSILGGAILFGMNKSVRKNNFDFELTLESFSAKANHNLYNKLNSLNQIVHNSNKTQDYKQLEKILDIPQSLSTKISSVAIFPISSESDKLDIFNKIASKLDTTSLKTFDYQLFKEQIKDRDFPKQKIVLKMKNDILPQNDLLSKNIISFISNDNFVETTRKNTLSSLREENYYLKKQLANIDSSIAYINKTFSNETPNNQINISGKKDNDLEKLYKHQESIIGKINDINNDITNNTKTYKLISSFPSNGVNNSVFSKITDGVWIGFLITLALLLLLKLNKFLNTKN